MEFFSEETIQLLVALLIGGIIGIEREYSNKSAGFRTMILICLGSTLLTIISEHIGSNSDDRVAANIITGIGFIGAGVVFKEGFTVVGLTTAASIWVTSALGMAIGFHDYKLATVGTILTIVVLFVLEYLQNFIDHLHHVKRYNIVFQEHYNRTEVVHDYIIANGLKVDPKLETKKNNESTFQWQ
ncbi:MAG TPA: MgtC/SapB family protein [Bacteroidia bacterium]|jgi:putative Mg2+ transporter-C (MgtC) family protein|nr:MgtC/SapB family protein [Bacteroidia bacterium]